jgi:hypothetical protein
LSSLMLAFHQRKTALLLVEISLCQNLILDVNYP